MNQFPDAGSNRAHLSGTVAVALQLVSDVGGTLTLSGFVAVTSAVAVVAYTP